MTITINGTTGIAGVDGSASVPAYKGNDTDTGLFYPSVNEVAAAAGGTAVWNASSTFGFKNRVINGKMDISQRGTSFTNVGAGSPPTYTLDRWLGFRGGFTANLDVSQQTGFGQFPNCLRMQRTSGTSSTQGMQINQIIETNNCFDMAGRTATFSVTMRAGANYSGGAVSIGIQTSTATNATAANLANGDFSAGSFSSNATVTTTATTYTATGVVPSNARTIAISISWTPTGTAGANDFIELTGCQLELGSQATSFDFRDYGRELMMCQRYYEISNAVYTLGGNVLTMFSFRTTKRSQPTVALSSGSLSGGGYTGTDAFRCFGGGVDLNWTASAEL